MSATTRSRVPYQAHGAAWRRSGCIVLALALLKKHLTTGTIVGLWAHLVTSQKSAVYAWSSLLVPHCPEGLATSVVTQKHQRQSNKAQSSNLTQAPSPLSHLAGRTTISAPKFSVILLRPSRMWYKKVSFVGSGPHCSSSLRVCIHVFVLCAKGAGVAKGLVPLFRLSIQ